MQHTKCGIAVLFFFDDDPQSDDIVNLVKRPILALHFSVDRVDVLAATSHLAMHAIPLEHVKQRILCPVDVRILIWPALIKLTLNLGEIRRLQVSEGKVFELALEL